ncbi:nth, partial [Symbiodinium microadriaticum]
EKSDDQSDSQQGDTGKEQEQADSSKQQEKSDDTNKAESGESDEQASQEQSSEESSSEQQSSQQPPPPPSSSFSNPLESLGQWLKLLVYIAVIATILFFVWKFWDDIVKAWDEFWASLFGGKKETKEAEVTPTEPQRKPRVAFSAFRNPFQDPSWKGKPLEEWVRYSFAALEAWAAEQGSERGNEQTPGEFASMLERQHNELANAVRPTADLYGQVAYGSGKARKVVRQLKKDYPAAECALNYDTPFQLLIATILSAQCTDVRVNIVTKDLFAKYPDAGSMSRASVKTLEELIKTTGFFRNKAKNIHAASIALADQYDGEVPQDLDALVALPGVGRKTANVVLGTAFGIPSGIVVDTHV